MTRNLNVTTRNRLVTFCYDSVYRTTQQHLEGLGHLDLLHLAVLPDPQLLKEALVHLSPDWFGRGLVVQPAAASHCQGLLQHRFDIADLGLGELGFLLCRRHGTRQALHLRLEQVERYGSLVVGFHELLALGTEASKLAVSPFGVLVRVGGLPREFGPDCAPQAGELGLG